VNVVGIEMPKRKKERDLTSLIWYLTPLILATQEAEISRIEVKSHPREIVCETLSQKKKRQKMCRQSYTGVFL
jgi:hypothetical protein